MGFRIRHVSSDLKFPGVIVVCDDDSDEKTVVGGDGFERLFVRPTPDIDLYHGNDSINPLLVDLIDVPSSSTSGHTDREGKTAGSPDGDFPRVKFVHPHPFTDLGFTRGHRLRRTRCFQGMYGKGNKPNEVVLLLDECTKDPSQTYDRSLCTAETTQVVKLRYLVKSNISTNT